MSRPFNNFVMPDLIRHPWTPDQVRDHVAPARKCTPAKAGVQNGQRYGAWTPAFAGEHELAGSNDMIADQVRGDDRGWSL